jgi:hypothetical protein
METKGPMITLPLPLVPVTQAHIHALLSHHKSYISFISFFGRLDINKKRIVDIMTHYITVF